jgi:hypothetical protein
VARIWSLTDQRRCDELEAPLALWRASDTNATPDRARAVCHTQRGVARWEQGEFDRGEEDSRRAHTLDPRDPVMEQNLLGALHRLVTEHVRAGRCQDARPLIAEGLAVTPGDRVLQRAAAT